MGCVKLLRGLDLTCVHIFTKYYQSVVIINKGDVDQVLITSNETEHKIQFNLKPSTVGKLFRVGELTNLVDAGFSKNDNKGVPEYNHSVDIVVAGTSEIIKTLLKQIDSTDYFAAIQFKNGDVEIYGFENGLKSNNYDYRAQSELGGAVITLASKIDEYDPPFLYFSNSINEDFNNLFENTAEFLSGDFNNDFSDDFYITNNP